MKEKVLTVSNGKLNAVASASATDHDDICLRGESFEHVHLDYRFTIPSPRSIIGFSFFENPTIAQLRKYASTVESLRRSSASYETFQNLQKAAQGLYGLRKVPIPFDRSFVTNTKWLEKKEVSITEMERRLSDKEASGPGMIPLGSYIKIWSLTRNKRAGRLHPEMEKMPAYHNCRLCPHKGGLIVGQRCLAHGQVWSEEDDSNVAELPFLLFFDGINRFVLVSENNNEDYWLDCAISKYLKDDKRIEDYPGLLRGEDGFKFIRPLHITLDKFLDSGRIHFKDLSEGHQKVDGVYIFDGDGTLMNFSNGTEEERYFSDGDVYTFNYGLEGASCSGDKQGTVLMTMNEMINLGLKQI